MISPKKKATTKCICASCSKKGKCAYFLRYSISNESEADKGFSIEIMECDDFKQ